MKNKFNETYNKIILESYHRKFGLFWTEGMLSKAIKGLLLKKRIQKELLASIDNVLVPKKWFSFKKVLKSKPIIEIDSIGGKNCKITVTYSADYDENEFEGLIEGREGKKFKGIRYNPAYGEIFEDLNDEDELNDDDELKEDDDSDDDEKSDLLEKLSSKVSIILNYKKVNYIDGIKSSKMKNPNYIKSFDGDIILQIGDNEDCSKKIGTITYAQSRYANMNPPKPLKQKIKEFWNKPATDFGLAGELVKGALGAIGTGLTGGLFSEVVQAEDVNINIDDQFQYKNNKETANKSDNDKRLLLIKKILQKSYNTSNNFNIVQQGDKIIIIYSITDKNGEDLRLFGIEVSLK